MNWDRISIAQRFLQRANGIHPDPSDERYLSDLALQEVYDQCYMASFSRSSLEQFFEAAAEDRIAVPEGVEDAGKFRSLFQRQAKKVHEDLVREGLL